jgi:anhydro-N-acetylmuramic acid kinase
MVYKVIGLMSGSSLDGLDLVFVHLHEQAGQWSFEIKAAACYDYPLSWREKLLGAAGTSAREYCRLHSAYGHYLGECVARFSREAGIELQADLIASHGHTVFHEPARGMTAQLGDGAALAAETHMAVVNDLRALDVALGGQGAPIVPLGEQLLFPDYSLFLNLGGIANLSLHGPEGVIAFDVCPANRVLDALASMLGKPFDAEGAWAAQGQINAALLAELNALPYYQQPWPKSLANEFGTETVLPLIHTHPLSVQGKLRTYVEHLVNQVTEALQKAAKENRTGEGPAKLLVTGGGAFNRFLIGRLAEQLSALPIEVVVPDDQTVRYKEALITALLGALRWRENNTTLVSVTGATRPSIGGALWMGQDG